MSPEIDLLTTLSTQPYSACEDQWNQLLRGLHLGGAYIPAIHAVLKEGRWKTQPNPIAYIRKSSVRVAARLGIVDVRPNGDREILASDLHYKDADGESLGHDDKLGTALYRHDEQFRAGVAAGFGSEYGSIYDEDYIGNRLPDSVMDENLEVDWDRVSQLAGMDAGERIVLKLRLSGLERDVALAACYTEEDRKILQAAWKRFDRHKELFKEVLMSGKSLANKRPQTGQAPQARRNQPIETVRPAYEGSPVLKARQENRTNNANPPNRVNETTPANHTPGAEPQLEMVLIQLPQGGMKISFRKCVAEKK